MGFGIFYSLPLPVPASPDGFSEDFESDPGARDLLPLRWEQVFDPEHPGAPRPPRFNTIRQLADREFHGGRGAVVFRTMGGRTALRLRDHHLIPIHPDRSYALSAWTRAVGLESDHMRLTLEWLDEQMNVLRTDLSDPLPAPKSWSHISVDVDAPPPKAVRARPVLRMEGPDVRGEGWFDDVQLHERLRLAVDSGPARGNLFPLGEPVAYTLTLRGADPGSYDVQRTVETVDGEIVVPRAAFARTADAAGSFQLADGYALPRAGYYEARYRLLREGRIVGERTVPVGVLGPLDGLDRPGDFGVAADPGLLPPPRIHLESILAQGGMRRVKIPLPPVGSGDAAADDLAVLVAGRFARHRFELIGMLQVPEAGAADDPAAPERALGARLRAAAPDWMDAFRAVVRRYRSSLKTFQLGPDGESSLAGASDLDDLLRRAGGAVGAELTFASLGLPVPWPPPLRDRPPDPLPSFFAVDATSRAAPLDLPPPAWLAASDERRLTLRLRPLEGVDRPSAVHAQLADLGRRAVEAKRAGWPTLYLAPLHGVPSALLDAEGFPTPAFHAWRTLGALLTDATYAGPAFAFEDVESHRFSRAGGGVIALWAKRGPVVKSFHLGPDVRLIDLAGDLRPLPADGRLRIGPEPTFLLGVNPRVIDFLRAITLEPPFLTLREGEQRTVRLVIPNRFAEPMRGLRVTRIRADAPGWTLSPPEARTALLPPEKAFEIPLAIRLPLSEVPGTREILAEVAFTADKPYATLVSLPIELRSPLKLTLGTGPGPAPGDLRAEVVVQNLHDATDDPAANVARTLRVRLTTALPSGPPQDQYFRLSPGDVKTFSYPLFGPGGRVVATARETGGDHFLTRELEVR